MSGEIDVRLGDLAKDAENWRALGGGLEKAAEEARKLGLEDLDLSGFGVDRAYRDCHRLAVQVLSGGAVTTQAIARRLLLAKQRFETADESVRQSLTKEWNPEGEK